MELQHHLTPFLLSQWNSVVLEFLLKPVFGNVKLKQSSQLFYQQNGFIQEQQRIAIQDMQLRQTTYKSSSARERKLFYRGEGEVGRGCYKQKSIGGN